MLCLHSRGKRTGVHVCSRVPAAPAVGSAHACSCMCGQVHLPSAGWGTPGCQRLLVVCFWVIYVCGSPLQGHIFMYVCGPRWGQLEI